MAPPRKKAAGASSPSSAAAATTSSRGRSASRAARRRQQTKAASDDADGGDDDDDNNSDDADGDDDDDDGGDDDDEAASTATTRASRPRRRAAARALDKLTTSPTPARKRRRAPASSATAVGRRSTGQAAKRARTTTSKVTSKAVKAKAKAVKTKSTVSKAKAKATARTSTAKAADAASTQSRSQSQVGSRAREAATAKTVRSDDSDSGSDGRGVNDDHDDDDDDDDDDDADDGLSDGGDGLDGAGDARMGRSPPIAIGVTGARSRDRGRDIESIAVAVGSLTADRAPLDDVDGAAWVVPVSRSVASASHGPAAGYMDGGSPRASQAGSGTCAWAGAVISVTPAAGQRGAGLSGDDSASHSHSHGGGRGDDDEERGLADVADSNAADLGEAVDVADMADLAAYEAMREGLDGVHTHVAGRATLTSTALALGEEEEEGGDENGGRSSDWQRRAREIEAEGRTQLARLAQARRAGERTRSGGGHPLAGSASSSALSGASSTVSLPPPSAPWPPHAPALALARPRPDDSDDGDGDDYDDDDGNGVGHGGDEVVGMDDDDESDGDDGQGGQQQVQQQPHSGRLGARIEWLVGEERRRCAERDEAADRADRAEARVRVLTAELAEERRRGLEASLRADEEGRRRGEQELLVEQGRQQIALLERHLAELRTQLASLSNAAATASSSSVAAATATAASSSSSSAVKKPKAAVAVVATDADADDDVVEILDSDDEEEEEEEEVEAEGSDAALTAAERDELRRLRVRQEEWTDAEDMLNAYRRQLRKSLHDADAVQQLKERLRQVLEERTAAAVLEEERDTWRAKADRLTKQLEGLPALETRAARLSEEQLAWRQLARHFFPDLLEAEDKGMAQDSRGGAGVVAGQATAAAGSGMDVDDDDDSSDGNAAADEDSSSPSSLSPLWTRAHRRFAAMQGAALEAADAEARRGVLEERWRARCAALEEAVGDEARRRAELSERVVALEAEAEALRRKLQRARRESQSLKDIVESYEEDATAALSLGSREPRPAQAGAEHAGTAGGEAPSAGEAAGNEAATMTADVEAAPPTALHAAYEGRISVLEQGLAGRDGELEAQAAELARTVRALEESAQRLAACEGELAALRAAVPSVGEATTAAGGPGDGAGDADEAAATARDLRRLEQRCAEQADELEVLWARLGRGEFDARTTKVLRFSGQAADASAGVATPDVLGLRSELARVKTALAAALATTASASSSSSSSSSSSTSSDGLAATGGDGPSAGPATTGAAVAEQLQAKELQIQRLKQAFNVTITEFRDAVFQLLGYKIEMSNRRFRLRSMYADSPDDCLVFGLDGETGALSLLHSDWAQRSLADTPVMNYLTAFQSFPAFLSQVTLDLFEKTTRAIPTAAISSSSSRV